MRKQKNKRGANPRSTVTQIIDEAPKKKDGKPNERFPDRKTVIHRVPFKEDHLKAGTVYKKEKPKP